jgi:indoleamine 2,3-dioxygenase
MNQNCWDIWPDRGFLMNPDPIVYLSQVDGLDALVPSEAIEHIEQVSFNLPDLLEGRQIRQTLAKLPAYDLSVLRDVQDFRVVERFMQIYCYFASAYIYATHEEPERCIPAGVAKPLYQLSQMVERPPIITYTSYVLGNWVRPEGGDVVVDDLKLVQPFLGVADESWFILIHADIEARATQALSGLRRAVEAAAHDDVPELESALVEISAGLERMIQTFGRMPEGCNSDVYYFQVRPYIFGFTDVLYEGVEAYGGKPQSFRGQTGAQSSIVPALVAGLGLEHEQNALIEHLTIMKDYMPKPHRAFVEQMHDSGIRQCVLAHRSALADAYNHALRKVIEFRQQHFHYATVYIAQKVSNPMGTGGTVFMEWLSQLVRESEAQLV